MMCVVMVAWNYIITPLYMHVPRTVVAGMLLPTILPFNLVKGGLNAGITMLIYKPVTEALRRAGLLARRSPAAAAPSTCPSPWSPPSWWSPAWWCSC